MSYGVMSPDTKPYRYLVKMNGVWTEHYSYSRTPVWDQFEPIVTDVIWRKAPNMIANWWQMRDGKKVDPYAVNDEDLTLILLQI